MKKLLILLLSLLLTGCTFFDTPVKKDSDTPSKPQKEVVEEEVLEPTENHFVVLEEQVEVPAYDSYLNDYYTNSVAFYHQNELVALISPSGENLVSKSGCQVIKKQSSQVEDVLNPGYLSIQCGDHFDSYGYLHGSLYFVSNKALVKDAQGVMDNQYFYYIVKDTSQLMRIDLWAYRQTKTLELEPFARSNTINRVYEVEETPTVSDGELIILPTGKVGIVGVNKISAEVLDTIKYEAVGISSQADENSLVTVIEEGQLKLVNQLGQEVETPSLQIVDRPSYLTEDQRLTGLKQLPSTSYLFNGPMVSLSSQSPYRIVSSNNLKGVIDDQGRVLLPFEYDEIIMGSTERALVKKENTWFILSIGFEKGKEINEVINEYSASKDALKEATDRLMRGQVCPDGLALWKVNADVGLYIRSKESLTADSIRLGLLSYQHGVCGKELNEFIEFDFSDTQKGYLYKEFMSKGQ